MQGMAIHFYPARSLRKYVGTFEVGAKVDKVLVKQGIRNMKVRRTPRATGTHHSLHYARVYFHFLKDFWFLLMVLPGSHSIRAPRSALHLPGGREGYRRVLSKSCDGACAYPGRCMDRNGSLCTVCLCVLFIYTF